MLEQSRASVNPDVLQLIEELCRVSETVKEEAKKESKDLLQQVSYLSIVMLVCNYYGNLKVIK